MLSQLYHSHLRDVPLVRLVNPPSKTSKAPAPSATTLGSVFKSTDFVLFFVVRGGTNGDHTQSTTIKSLGAALQAMVTEKATTTGTTASPSVRKRLFGFKKNGSGKAKLTDSTNESSALAVVVVNIDAADVGNGTGGGQDMPPTGLNFSGFYHVVPLPYHIRGCLLRSLRFVHSPSIIVVNSHTLTITTTQGRRCLMGDPQRKNNFPWLNTSINQLLGGKVLMQVENPDEITVVKEVEMSSLPLGVKGLYFAAKWCPPCRLLTQQLVQAYEQLKKAKPAVNFEILLCSLDRTRGAFEEHLSSMPWLALPYDTTRVQELAKTLDVNGCVESGKSARWSSIIARCFKGRNQLLSDPTGKSFPWERRPIYELDETTLHRVTELPSLILFTEGSPGDNEFARQILEPLAEEVFAELQHLCEGEAERPIDGELGTSRDDATLSHKSGSTNSAGGGDENSLESHSSSESEKSAGKVSASLPLQLFYTGEDPICDHLLESLSQTDADLPLLVILDTLVGCLAICDNPDVSTEVVKAFIANYREGRGNSLQKTYRRSGTVITVQDQTTLVDASMTDATPEHKNNNSAQQNSQGVTL